MPPAGIPLRRLLLRSLRSAGARRPSRPRPDPARACRSRRRSSLLLARRPAAIFTTGGYVAIPTLLAAAVLRIPSVLWEGNVVPGRSVRFVAGAGERARGELRGDGGGARAPARVRHGDPDPVAQRASTRTRRARRSAAGPGERILLVFGGSQAVRRINDAVVAALPRLVERVRVVHVTGDAGYAAALAAREALPADLRDRYRPHAFLHGDEMTAALAAADLAVGRAGASTIAEAPPSPCRWRSCRTRTPPATSGATPSSTPPPVPRSWSRTRTSTPTGWSRSRACSPTRPRTPRCRPRRAISPGPTPPTAVADLVLAMRAPRGAAQPGRDRGGRPGSARVTGTPASGPAAASTRSPSGPTSSAGSGSRRRATSRWRGSRRCASAGRPTCSPSPTTCSSCAASCATRARERSRCSCSAAGATS